MQYLDQMEIGVCLRVNGLARHDALRRLFVLVSRMGDGGYWVAMGLVLLFLQGNAALPVLLHFSLTGLFGVWLYKRLKTRLVRERPFIFHRSIRCATAPLDRYSFPSGHTLHAVMFTVLFAQVEPLMIWFTAPFAVLVALSRVVLGLHYPSDVVVGAALGGAIASLSLALL